MSRPNTTFLLSPFLSLPATPAGLSVSVVNFLNTHTGPGELTMDGSVTPGNIAVAYSAVGEVGFATGSQTGSDKIQMYATYSNGTTSNIVDLNVNIQASAPPPPPPPQNTSGPVVNSNVQPFQVTVGQQGVLSSANLNASDAAYPDPSQISYEITGYPTQGFIYDNGQLARSFTQADINSGHVVYQASVQPGLASETTDTLTYVVSDPSFRWSPVTTVPLKIEPLPAPIQSNQPYVDTNAFPILMEGGQEFVTANMLHITDNNPNIPPPVLYIGSAKDTAITYTVVQGPSHGKLEWLTNYPSLWSGGASWFGQPVTKFTQTDLNDGWFAYVNDFTSGACDSFTFTVSDGFGGAVGVTTATLPVQAVDPVLVRINAGMFVTNGGQSKLYPDWLLVDDGAPNANPNGFSIFQVAQGPSHGTLLLNGQAASSFTQLDIDRGLVTYQQNGSAAQSDQFTLAVVTDAYGNSIPNLVVPVTIGTNALDRNTGAVAGVGQSVSVQDANLHAADPGLGSGNSYADDASLIAYTLTALPQHGTVTVGGVNLQLGGQFTQAQIDNNQVAYTEDGSIAASDLFGFAISNIDNGNSLGSGAFNITIANTNGGRVFVGGTASDIFYSGPGNNFVRGAQAQP